MRPAIYAMCVALYAVSGCRHADSSIPNDIAPVEFELLVRDDMANREFDLSFTTKDSRPACFMVEQWPSKLGSLDTGSQRAWVVIDGNSFPAADDEFGLCPGGCGYVRVEPNQTLSGKIGYDQFKSAGRYLERVDKSLKYQVFPEACRKDMKVVTPR